MVAPDRPDGPVRSDLDEETRRRVDALISLLGDESPKVYSTAWDHLEKLGEAAYPLVQRAAASSSDPRVRVQAGRFLLERERRRQLEHWIRYAAEPSLDLETGVLLISASEYPADPPTRVSAQLDEWATVLRRRLAGARTTESAVQRLVALLHGELGFSGREVDYEDPDASYLHRVLERRAGLPILLSVVYLLVARRVDLPLFPVGMPQHFLLKYPGRSGEVFLDPFHGGRRLTAGDCRSFLEASGIGFDGSFLRTAKDREIISRVLGNLLRVYHARQDHRRVHRVLAMLRLVESRDSTRWS